MPSGGSSDATKCADTHPLLPRPYPVGCANGSSSAIGPLSGSLTDRPSSSPSAMPRNTNTFLPTLITRSPHGNSSRAPGKPSAKSRSAAFACFIFLPPALRFFMADISPMITIWTRIR